jgi:uncharacterized protein with PIN domain
LDVTTYLLRCVEIGREQQARHGKLRRDLAGVIRTRWPDVSIELAPGRLLLEAPADLAAELAALPGVLSVSPCVQAARGELLARAVDVARASFARDSIAHNSIAHDSLAPDSLARDSIAHDSIARDSFVNDSTACDSIVNDSIAHDSAARDSIARGSAADSRDDRTFAVRVRRDRRFHRERSLDVAGAIAEAITAATGARVDLDHPDVIIGVELRGDTALVFDRVIPGVDQAGPMVPPAPGEPRFVADQMLGRLAARLRLLGYDTLTVYDIADSEVTRLAAGRILLTRDAALARTQAVPAHFVVATSPREQLAEVIAALGLEPDPARLFTRCTLCNTPVEPAAEDDVDVPPGVRGQHLAFFRCPSCGQVYWRGSHVERILDDLADSGVHSRKSTDASR